VTEVLSADSSTASPVAPRRSSIRSATSYTPPSDTAVEETGRVNWFNTEKGYGFITRDDGAEDVFVHISAVERSGLTGLSEGDRVIVDVCRGAKRARSGKGSLGLGRGPTRKRASNG
jgi:CspA family cold shock protein